MRALLGIIFMGCCVLATAQQQLDDLFKTSQTEQSSVLVQAKELYAKGFFNKAVRLLHRETKKRPDYFNGYILLGYLHYDRQDFERGALYFAKAIKLDPAHKGALFMRGTCFLKGGKYRLALKDYLQCIQIDRDFYPAYNNIAVVRLLYQDIEQTNAYDLHLAKKDMEAILGLGETSADKAVNFNMGFIYLLLWEYDASIAMFNTAIASDAAYGKAWFYRGMAKYYQKDYSNAKADFAMAQQLGFQPERCTAFLVRLDKILNYLSLQRPERPEGW